VFVLLPSQGGSGKLTLLAGDRKEELKLKPVFDSALGTPRHSSQSRSRMNIA